MDKATKRTVQFDTQVMMSIILPNVAGAFVMTIYCLCFSGFSGGRLAPGVAISGIIIIFFQLVLSLFTTKFVVADIAAELSEWECYPSTQRERTRLLRKVMGCPAKLTTLVFVMLTGGTVLWLLSLRWLFDFSGEALVMVATAATMSSFTVALLVMSSSQRICSSYGCRLVAQGLDRQEIQRRKTYGISSISLAILYGLLPMLMISIVSIMVAWRSTTLESLSMEGQLGYLLLICAMNLLFVLFFAFILSRRVMVSITRMRNMLGSLDRSSFHTAHNVSTDLSNSFMYNIYLVNSIIALLQHILKDSREVSTQVVASSNELDHISHDTLAMAIEQSCGIRELLVAVERADVLANNVALKIGDVTLVTHRTEEDVCDCISLLEQKVGKLGNIMRTNQVTSMEIKELQERISGISDIALIINSIADQTSLIAFNAEMEASNIGSSGQEFHLVAQEIRQLATGIVDLTKEIRGRIGEIQHTTQNLLDSSRISSKLVEEGQGMVGRLITSFNEMKKSVGESDLSSMEIQAIARQQKAVFGQVVVTLRQLAATTDNLSVSIRNISQSAGNLSVASGQLESIQQNLEGEEVV